MPPPALWSVVQQFVGGTWPDGNPAELRSAAAAWRAAASRLNGTGAEVSGTRGTIAGQSIDEGPAVAAHIDGIAAGDDTGGHRLGVAGPAILPVQMWAEAAGQQTQPTTPAMVTDAATKIEAVISKTAFNKCGFIPAILASSFPRDNTLIFHRSL